MTTPTPDILGKADALMQRHHSFIASQTDDVPVLTEEVESWPENRVDAKPSHNESRSEDMERLISETLTHLEPKIEEAVKAWLASELPHIVVRELGTLGQRVLQAANGALQKQLMPEIARLIQESENRAQSDK